MLDRRRFLAAGLGAATAAAATTLIAGRAPAQGAAGAAASPAPVAVALPQGGGLAPELMPQMVRIKPQYAPGSIVVVPPLHFLYLVTAPGQAIRYGVGVGREGMTFKGQALIQVKKEWPTWRPTDEMIARSPVQYGKFKDTDYVQPGGPGNPLGARALYLFQNGRDTYFRIHGTIEPQSIGRSVSSGCIRMLNEHVTDLYARVPVGTPVLVL